jgi:magnesium transporter
LDAGIGPDPFPEGRHIPAGLEPGSFPWSFAIRPVLEGVDDIQVGAVERARPGRHFLYWPATLGYNNGMNQQGTPKTRYFHIHPEGRFNQVETQKDALALLENSGYVWFDFLDPSKEDLQALIKPLGLHPLSIDDCLDQDQVPKIEDFPSHNFILFNEFRRDEKTVFIDEIDFFLGKNYLISVSRSHGATGGSFARLADAIERDLMNVRKGPDFLLHVLMDYVVDEKFRAIEALQEELDMAEETVIEAPAAFKPEVLLHLRRNLLILRKSLFHEREILVRICRRDSPFISESAIYHFRDIYDHLAKFFEAIEIYREMITSLMEIYLSVLNNRMTIVANRTNQIVRRLTLINTIFMPLTLLAGIGGMSEWSMMTGPKNWTIAYPVFLVLMGALGIGNYLILKRLEARDRAKAEKSPMELGE